jgi:hypothetical protein
MAAHDAGRELVVAVAELIRDRGTAGIDQVEARRHRTRAPEQLHRVVAIAARAVCGGDADLGQLAVEQVAPVRGRRGPAVEQQRGQIVGVKAIVVAGEGDVLGDQAVVVAVSLGTIGGLAAIGLMSIAVGAGHVLGETLRRAGQSRLGGQGLQVRHRTQVVGAREQRGRDLVVIRRGVCGACEHCSNQRREPQTSAQADHSALWSKRRARAAAARVQRLPRIRTHHRRSSHAHHRRPVMQSATSAGRVPSRAWPCSRRSRPC